MGNMVPVITRRNESAGKIPDITNPSRADWITTHAKTSGLSIAEVARLWLRFQQLGCNAKGVITDEQIRGRDSPVGNDPFLRNIMTKIKDQPGAEGVVTFISYINTMYWLEVVTKEEKLRAVFCLLNNGSPLSEVVIRQVLSKVFENESNQSVERTTKALLEVAGNASVDGDGLEIVEDDFVKFTIEIVPPSVLDSLLNFQVVPRKVAEEAKMDKEGKGRSRMSSLSARSADQKPSPAPRNMKIENSHQIPTTAQLEMVAGHIFRRDYRLVGNKLGFFESDMNHMENMYPGDRRQQVAFLLHEWRKREGARAYTILLQRALQEASMGDIAATLQSNPTARR